VIGNPPGRCEEPLRPRMNSAVNSQHGQAGTTSCLYAEMECGKVKNFTGTELWLLIIPYVDRVWAWSAGRPLLPQVANPLEYQRDSGTDSILIAPRVIR